jgi:peptidoglycan/LPS O-acetylase OafA/YrhL
MTASPLLAPAPTGRVRPSPPPRGEGSSRPRDSSGAPHGEYRPDIDGLRAVAVLAVVAYHTKAWVLPGGFVGVDVFFVISGFLISGIILQRLQKGTFSIADFYARRIRRIFPALSLVLVTCLAVGWFVLLPGELADLGGDVAAGAGFVSNIRFWTQTNYFGPDVDAKPLLHLWSLGIEEQYYLLWPFVLAFLWRGSHRVAPMVGLMVVSFAISLTLSFTDARSAFYLPVTRLWELLLGSLVAYAVFAHGRPGAPRLAPDDARRGRRRRHAHRAHPRRHGVDRPVADRARPRPPANDVGLSRGMGPAPHGRDGRFSSAPAPRRG